MLKFLPAGACELVEVEVRGTVEDLSESYASAWSGSAESQRAFGYRVVIEPAR